MDQADTVSPVRAFRLEAKMTQKALATEAGVDMSYLSQIETGKQKNVGIETARKIARALSDRLGREIGIEDLFPDQVVPAMCNTA